jgi:hypothetical protein
MCISVGPLCLYSLWACLYSLFLCISARKRKNPTKHFAFLLLFFNGLLYTVWYWTKTQLFQNTERIVILENADYLGRGAHKRNQTGPYAVFWTFLFFFFSIDVHQVLVLCGKMFRCRHTLISVFYLFVLTKHLMKLAWITILTVLNSSALYLKIINKVS